MDPETVSARNYWGGRKYDVWRGNTKGSSLSDTVEVNPQLRCVKWFQYFRRRGSVLVQHRPAGWPCAAGLGNLWLSTQPGCEIFNSQCKVGNYTPWCGCIPDGLSESYGHPHLELSQDPSMFSCSAARLPLSLMWLLSCFTVVLNVAFKKWKRQVLG